MTHKYFFYFKENFTLDFQEPLCPLASYSEANELQYLPLYVLTQCNKLWLYVDNIYFYHEVQKLNNNLFCLFSLSCPLKNDSIKKAYSRL